MPVNTCFRIASIPRPTRNLCLKAGNALFQ